MAEKNNENESTELEQDVTKEFEDDKKMEETSNASDDDSFVTRMAYSIFEWGNTLIAALVIILLLMTFVFRHVTVDGVSMNDTLQNHDHLITTDIFYTPHAGDIVIISHGQNYNKALIKRVIAVEGQTLSINYNTGEVVVDGVLLDETYIKGTTKQPNRNPMDIPEVIPEGYVFVMGDNRERSLDSRSEDVGLISVNDIIGKATFRIYPFNSIGFVS